MATLGSDGVYYGGPIPTAKIKPARWGAVGRVARRIATLPARIAWRSEKRAITDVPWDHGGSHYSAVSHEAAMRLVPVWAAIRILADNIASLPLQAFRKAGDTRIPMASLPQLLADPAVRQNRFGWVHQAIWSLALRGNAYGYVTSRDGYGYPTSIEWLYPDEVHVDETNPVMPVYRWLGNVIPLEDVVHIGWMVPAGRVKGMSPIAAFAATIGIGLAATEYGKSWFDSDGTPPATFRNTKKTLAPGEADTVKGRLAAALRTRQPLVYGADWEFNVLRVSPEESQFIQTMRLNAAQIAAIYGVPPEMVAGDTGESMTYSNQEQHSIRFVQFTLRPWLERLEATLNTLLPARVECSFNVDAFTRSDLLTRYQAHAIGIASGFLTPDEVRAIEDRPPLPNGAGMNPRLPAPAPPADEPTAAVERYLKTVAVPGGHPLGGMP